MTIIEIILDILTFSVIFGWIAFYSLLIYSAKHQESYVKNTIFFNIFSIIGIILPIYYLLTYVLILYYDGSFIIVGFLHYAIAFHVIQAPLFLLIYAIQNREHFDFYLIISATLFLSSNIYSLFTGPFFLFYLDITSALLTRPDANTLTGIFAFIFLIIYGFKNKDKWIAIAGTIQGALISFLFIISFIFIVL